MKTLRLASVIPLLVCVVPYQEKDEKWKFLQPIKHNTTVRMYHTEIAMRPFAILFYSWFLHILNKTLCFYGPVNLAHAENGLHPPVNKSSILLLPQIREFKKRLRLQLRLRLRLRLRQRHKITVLHVPHAFWHFSLPYSAQKLRGLTNFTFSRQHEHTTVNLSFSVFSSRPQFVPIQL